jgi:hypothetical protein
MSLLEPPHVNRGSLMDPNVYGHSRTRTTSSGIFPYENQSHPANQRLSYYSNNTTSSNTFSSSGSYASGAPPTNTMSMHIGGGGPQPSFRVSSSSSGDLRRSTSSRSGASVVVQTSGYVALLRKQKATVWCDRPQAEDPTIIAQRQHAKMRAQHEIWRSAGGNGYSSGTVSSTGRTSTGLGSSSKMGKIRHTKPALLGFNPGENHVGVGGVPMRLSATEVEGESSDDDDTASARLHHRRTGSSGRSSIGSARRGAAYRSGGPGGSQSSRKRSPGDTPERAGSLVEEQPEDLQGEIGVADGGGDNNSFHSGDDAEAADNLGELGAASRLAAKSQRHSAMTREKSIKSVEELRRRGSVDERTSTLTGMSRLYIANPD